MYEKVVKQDGKTFGVRIATPDGDQIIYATGEEQWKSLQRLGHLAKRGRYSQRRTALLWLESRPLSREEDVAGIPPGPSQ